jgi:hypothetical protein
MHLNDRMLETHLSTPISQTFALIAGDCNTTSTACLLAYICTSSYCTIAVLEGRRRPGSSAGSRCMVHRIECMVGSGRRLPRPRPGQSRMCNSIGVYGCDAWARRASWPGYMALRLRSIPPPWLAHGASSSPQHAHATGTRRFLACQHS